MRVNVSLHALAVMKPAMAAVAEIGSSYPKDGSFPCLPKRARLIVRTQLGWDLRATHASVDSEYGIEIVIAGMYAGENE